MHPMGNKGKNSAKEEFQSNQAVTSTDRAFEGMQRADSQAPKNWISILINTYYFLSEPTGWIQTADVFGWAPHRVNLCVCVGVCVCERNRNIQIETMCVCVLTVNIWKIDFISKRKISGKVRKSFNSGLNLSRHPHAGPSVLAHSPAFTLCLGCSAPSVCSRIRLGDLGSLLPPILPTFSVLCDTCTLSKPQLSHGKNGDNNTSLSQRHQISMWV